MDTAAQHGCCATMLRLRVTAAAAGDANPYDNWHDGGDTNNTITGGVSKEALTVAADKFPNLVFPSVLVSRASDRGTSVATGKR